MKRSLRRQPAAATLIPAPVFRSEKEEAAWWDSHPQEVDDFIRRAEAEGNVTVAPLPGRPTTIRLVAGDVERARVIAHRKGMRYQTYLKMLIHEALDEVIEKEIEEALRRQGQAG